MHAKTFLVVLLAVPALAISGFKVPSKIYQVSELEKAKIEAAAKGKPISFLYSDKDSTCPLCSSASEVMIKELSNKTVMVYARTTSDLPPQVIKALEPGRFIPKVAILDPTLETSLGTVTYESVSEDPDKAFRAVEKAIREYGKKK